MNYIIIIIIVTIIIIINTVPHKARITQTYLDDNGIHLMEHRPYSPDLASCDFWPFPKVKSALAGKHFSKIQDLAQAVHAEMRAIPASEYQKCFQKWGMRIQRFIEATLSECDCNS